MGPASKIGIFGLACVSYNKFKSHELYLKLFNFGIINEDVTFAINNGLTAKPNKSLTTLRP